MPHGHRGGKPFRWACHLALALLGLFCLSCGPLSSPVIYDPKPSVGRLRLEPSAIRTEADELAEPLITSKEATCVEIGVLLPDGSIQDYGYGRTRDKGRPQVPDRNTLFQVGSISKLFTASLLKRLVQAGEMNYSDTLREVLPPDMTLSQDAGRITLLELVTHTSGLPREPVTLRQFLYLIDYEFTGHNIYGYMDKAWLRAYLKSYKAKPDPHPFVYSNLGYGLLAYLIEAKTEQPFQDLVTDNLFSPLHMTDTTFVLSKEQQGRLAAGHVGDQPYFMKRNTALAPWDMGEIMSPSGGAYSTASDLLLYAKHLLATEAPPLGSASAGTTEASGYPPDLATSAAGWSVAEFRDDHTRILYKQGMTAGYNAYIGINLSRGMAVVVLCNAFNWKDKIGHNLLLRLSGASAP